jgi:hypothetical protein
MDRVEGCRHSRQNPRPRAGRLVLELPRNCRADRPADFVGKGRVVASSDCGFGTFAGYGKIDPAVAWKKLAVLREGADIADRRIR